MGKKAVPVALFQNDQNRRSTFKKRLVGLMKKIHDLSILCDVQIAVIVIDENKEIHPYTNNQTIEEVWNQYFNKDKETKSTRLLECKKALAIEIKKTEIACHAKKKPKQGILQNVGIHYGALQNNEEDHKPSWSINSNRPQYQINQGSTSSSEMANLQNIAFNATNQERNGNNWSNDSNYVNHGNTNYANEVHQTLYYRTNVNNHLEYGYNVEGQRHEVQHQYETNLQDPPNYPIDVGDNHPRYGYNVEGQGHEVQHQYQTNLQDPPNYPIDVGDNHPRYGDNVEGQGHEVRHQSQALLQDPLGGLTNVDTFPKTFLACMNSNVKPSNLKALGVTRNVLLSKDLNPSKPSTGPSILPRDAPYTEPPTERNTSYISPLRPIESGLAESWEGWDNFDFESI